VDEGRHRVVVVGGGFGGLQVAQKLGGTPLEVILVDRRNFHLFQPLTYQVATGSLSPGDIAYPLRAIFKRRKNVHVVLAEVEGFDLEAREVRLRSVDGVPVPPVTPYDTLVVAGGSRYAYFGNDEWSRYVLEVKSLESALGARSRILEAFEAAELEGDPARRAPLLTFVVVGAGPTGVEMAGQIAELSRDTLRHDFRAIDPRTARIEARTVIWAAGVAASGLARELGRLSGAPVDRAGRVTVEPDLSLPGHPEVFALGDMVTVRGPDGAPVVLPGVAPVAMQQGRYVADVIQARLAGKEAKPFHYRDKGNLATIGRASAVADVRGFRLSGFVAWVTWLVVHLWYLVGFQNRLIVLVRWSFSFLTHGRGSRLIASATLPAPTEEEP